MRQSHPLPHGHYTQDPNAFDSDRDGDIPTSSYEFDSQASFLSNAIDHQPASSQYAALDIQIKQQYEQQDVYPQGFLRNYLSHAHNQLPFPLVRSPSSDVVTHALGQRNAPGQGNLRRNSLPLQPGPIRERTPSLSYYRGNESAGSHPSLYTSQPYTHDTRNPAAHHTRPPNAYRPTPSQAIHQKPPISHPTLSHLDTGVSYETRCSSASSLMPPHLRGEMPVSSTQPPLQQEAAAASLPSSSETQPRPHICEICGLAFVRSHDLKRHRDTHSSLKLHVCECGRSFSRRDALRRHIFLKSCPCNKSGDATSEDQATET